MNADQPATSTPTATAATTRSRSAMTCDVCSRGEADTTLIWIKNLEGVHRWVCINPWECWSFLAEMLETQAERIRAMLANRC